MSTVKTGSAPAVSERVWSGREAALGRPSRALLRRFLQSLLHRLGNPPIRFLCGAVAVGGSGESEAITVELGDAMTLLRLATNPELEFGRAFADGRIEVHGDLIALLRVISRRPEPTGPWKWARAVSTPRPRSNTLRASRENIHEHYDLGNDFYSLWLDPEMVYTCAYYSHPGMTLEEAQLAKMEHVCRKLQLQPRQRVVEAGGGWGALAIYMARHHGVHVRSYNISEAQIETARERARHEGLETRVEFVHDDYRNIRGEFDAFVSVGMLEHVGRPFYEAFGRLIHRSLKPGGLAFVHSIGRNRPRPLNQWIERYIFPGAYPPSLHEVMSVFEPNDLSVLDVENLRLHYALTMRDWLKGFEANAEAIERRFGTHFTRSWRLYLSGSLAAFETGSLQLFQIVANRAESNRLPMTRSHLYSAPEAPGHAPL